MTICKRTGTNYLPKSARQIVACKRTLRLCIRCDRLIGILDVDMALVVEGCVVMDETKLKKRNVYL